MDFIQPDTDTICAYIEHLVQSFRSAKSVRNYISAIGLLHKFVNKSSENLQSFEVSLMLRAATLSMRAIPVRKAALPMSVLRDICVLCDNKGLQGLVIKVALLTGFFAFLRASNLCPPSPAKFDHSRHLTRGDIQFASPGILLKLKWSKSLQQAMQPRIIPLTRAHDPIIDVVSSMGRMINHLPAQSTAPLFMLPTGNTLTVGQLRETFASMLQTLGLSSKQFSLHSLRRGGATASFAAGAKYIDIKRHGAWSSDTFFHYLSNPPPQDSSVCKALAQATKCTM